MKPQILRELSCDCDHNVRYLVAQSRVELIRLARLSSLMVKDIDQFGRLAALNTYVLEVSRTLAKLTSLSGEIQGMRRLTVSLETVLNCCETKLEEKQPEQQRFPTPQPRKPFFLL